MTRDDIIRTAREAGLFVGTNISGVQLVGGVPEDILRSAGCEDKGKD